MHRWITVLTTFRIQNMDMFDNETVPPLQMWDFWKPLRWWSLCAQCHPCLLNARTSSAGESGCQCLPWSSRPKKNNNWNCPRAKSKLRNGYIYIYICMNTVGWARPSFCPSMVTPWTTLPHQRVVNVPSRSSTLEEATVSSTFLKHFSRDKELAY